ncbi:MULTISPECIES: hypothetical protein [Arsenophonus]|uniref:hypothetical protein n=1 Tax=Arsenophonus TaxID=637 RepID=UPI00387A235B
MSQTRRQATRFSLKRKWSSGTGAGQSPCYFGKLRRPEFTCNLICAYLRIIGMLSVSGITVSAALINSLCEKKQTRPKGINYLGIYLKRQQVTAS